ncbi:hypothetical protein BKA70DRAFT_826214 [Coprinopsis sp. MPI-PUGE-AT-0042]|nr:hypothetical protein BKA70DRAFT_826214 [Coprinopsis sp. MPI-PUGE-AT-0042]
MPPKETTKTVDYSVVHDVPGHGKPLTYVPDESDPLFVGSPLPSALSTADLDEGGAVLPLTTLREFSMLQFMNAITDKENWHVKVFDNEIANKWKTEAIRAARAELKGEEVKEGTESVRSGGEDGGEAGVSVKEASTEQQDAEDDQGGDNEDDDDERFAQWPIHFVPRDESMMTSAMADYCIAELRHKATAFEQSTTGAIAVYNGDVVKSDKAISLQTKEALRKAVEPLEDVSDKHKDWHPVSDERVLDLVHPSLFPLIYGRSKVLAAGEKVTTLKDFASRSGEGDVIPSPEQPRTQRIGRRWRASDLNPYSTKFQWLPCEVDIAGDKPKIVSYINNLHPEEHTALYGIIEDVIAASIPLWEMTLAPMVDEDFSHVQRILYDGPEYDPDPYDFDDSESGPPVDDDNDDSWEFKEEWKDHIRRTILPEPGVFNADELKTPEPFSLKDTFGKLGRPLQIIVKLANIELTPEKPEYEGGSWHVEGKLNEHIVATALYYYSSENITRSSLAFRQLSNARTVEETQYEQNVHDFLWDVYGCSNDDGSVQEVGSVETREGRLLTFPNILQHQVQPFELEDPTKPGHRKILALFLVDPNVRVLSTAHVPPQQLDWWRKSLNEGNETNLLNDLPAELQDHVYSEVDEFPISLEEAKSLREELMHERKDFALQHSKAFEASLTFSLCEH